MGEDCWLSQDALRDMRNPMRYGQPSYYGGTYWAAGNDVQRILELVRQSAADRPPDLPPAYCQILPGGRVKC